MKLSLAAAAVCFVLAAFFKFALIGYTFTALLFAGLGVVILLYRLFARRGMKRARLALTAVLCLGAVLFAAAEVPVVRAAGGDGDAEADWLIVLGAGVNGSTPSLSMVNRLDKAQEYLESHPDCRAVLSGGQGRGEDVTEARAMYVWLTARGVAPERLILEEEATSTEENLRFSLALLGGEAESASIAVVSSEYHLYRAEYIARLLGTEVSGLAGRTSYPVLKANYFIREAFAVWYLWLFGL